MSLDFGFRFWVQVMGWFLGLGLGLGFGFLATWRKPYAHEVK